MTMQQLEDLCDEILVSADSENSALLSAMSNAELQDAYIAVAHQYGVELVYGADKNSTWMNGVLVIGANDGPIIAAQAAFAAVQHEMSRRRVDPPNVALGCQ
jgi:hypothetical protein